MLEQTAPAAMGSPAPALPSVAQAGPTQPAPAETQAVLIQFPVGTLGDTMGWFPYAVKFLEKHRCKLTCAMAEKLIPLFKDAYPEIRFLTEKEVEAERETEPQRYYASYRMGLF